MSTDLLKTYRTYALTDLDKFIRSLRIVENMEET